MAETQQRENSNVILHTGDTHLGYRQYNQPARQQDFAQAFADIVSEAIDLGVDVFVHSGDLFHHSRPSISAVNQAAIQFQRLQSADIRVLAIVGNHDSNRDMDWVEVFDTLGLLTKLDRSGVVVGNATFYGLDYTPPSLRENLQATFEPSESDYSFLVTHGLFEPLPAGDWDLSPFLERSNLEFDAILAGDYHAPVDIEVADTLLTYCNSTERTASDQRKTRGYQIVTCAGNSSSSPDASPPSFERVGLPTRQFRYLDVVCSDDTDSETDADTEPVTPGSVVETISGTDVDDVISVQESSPKAIEGAVIDEINRIGEGIEEAVVVVTIHGQTSTESLPLSAIEGEAYDHGALYVTVNDRRNRETVEREYQDISWGDPDQAAIERIRSLEITPVARSLEDSIRGDTPKSNLIERTKQTVTELLTDEQEDSLFEASKVESESQDEGKASTTTDSEGNSESSESSDEDAQPVQERPVQPESTNRVEQNGEQTSVESSEEPPSPGETESEGTNGSGNEQPSEPVGQPTNSQSSSIEKTDTLQGDTTSDEQQSDADNTDDSGQMTLTDL